MAGTRPIYLTNTLGHRLEEFRSIEPGRIRMYTCGPTVYGYSHIGNFRSFIFADTLRRMFEYNGYHVTQVRNITDVGHLTDETLGSGLDKLELAAQRENRSAWDIAAYYTEVFHQHAHALNLLEPDREPRASEYVPEMIELTQSLIEKGYAYPGTANVYFDVTRFPTYGELSGNTVDDLVAGSRVEVGEDKRSPGDFALWRAQGPEKVMRWDSPWGMGIPGWHIECSAMSIDLLGPELDVHTGGVDNIFPHHEDERAQSEAATGKPFVRFWLHSEWLQLGLGEKMSKSLGNIYTVSDLQESGIHPLAYRYFSYMAHYRTQLAFSWEALEASQTALYSIWEQAAELVQAGPPAELDEATASHADGFHQAINRDLNMPAAVAALHDMLGSKGLPAQQKRALLCDFDRVLALKLDETGQALSAVSDSETAILHRRQEARREKNWPESDALRAALAERGVDVKDTPLGQRWIRRDLLPTPGSKDAK